MALNVGELYAELRIDADQFTRGLQDGQRSLGTLSDAARRAAQEASRSSDAQVQAYGRLRQAAATAAQAVQRSHGDAATAAEQVRVAEERLLRTRQQGGDVDAAERRLVQARRESEHAADRAAQAVDRMEAANRRAAAASRGIDFGRVEREARDAADATERIERGAEQAADATRRIELPGSLRNAADGIAGAFERIGGQATALGSRAGGDLGGGLMSGVSGAVGQLGTKAGPIGVALAGLAAVGLGAGAVLAGSIADGMQQQADLAKVQARLGVDDATMRTIGKAASDSYNAGWGESQAANAEAAQAAIESGLLTGDELAPDMTPTINNLQLVADMMGEEVPAVARAAGQAVKNGLVGSTQEAFDLLVKSQQNSLNVSEDLLDSQIEYSTQLRALGLEGVEGWALVSQGVKGGARDTDVVIDGLKELKLRATDGTAAAADGFEYLKLNAEDWTRAMNEGGKVSRDALADALRGLNDIKDPAEKNAAALALFGTKFEDMQGAALEMNLDTAVQQFGEVGGAAQRAGDIIQNTTAARFERAQRTIETSMNGVKLSMAEAFGPTLQKVADWVAEHQPEIIGFFGSLADGAFACLDGIAAFVSGALDYFATMAEGSASFFGGMLDNLGTLASGIGSVVKHIPGMQDTGAALEGVGGAMQGYRDKMTSAAETMRGWSDTIDNRVRPGLQSMRDSVAASTQAAQDSALMFRALGDGVNAVPTEHGIAINTNQPEVIAALEGLNLKTRTLEDGTVEVYADTAEGQRIIDNFVGANDGRVVTMQMKMQRQLGMSDDDWSRMRAAAAANAQANGSVVSGTSSCGRFADGGTRLPEQAVIQQPHGKAGLIQWAEPETGGEAFIPLAPGKRARSLRILAETAARMGMAVVDPTGLGALLGQGDYTGRVGRTFGWQEDAPEVDALLGLRDRDRTAIRRGTQGIVSREHGKVFHGDPHSLDDRSDPTGWRRFLGGDYTPAMGRWAGSEDSALVDAMFGTRAMLANGDYDGSLAKYGVQEDHPLVGLLLDAHKLSTRSFADGGITGGYPAENLDAAVSFAKSKDDLPYSYGGSSGDSWDCSGYQSGIYNKITGKSVRFTTDSDFAALGFVPGYDPNGFSIGTNGGSGENGHMAGTLFGVNVESGSANGVQYGGPALGAQDFDKVWHLPGASRTGQGDDPSTENLNSLERQLEKARADESAATTDEDRRKAGTKIAALQAQIDALKSSSGPSSSGNGTPVYVTNWPSNLGGTSTSSTPTPGATALSGPAPAQEPEVQSHDISTPAGRASLAQAIGAKFFANGGFGGVGGENHSAHVAPAGSWRVFAEPETGGEAYIPLSPAKRNTSLAVWAQTGQRLGAFAVGAGLAAASGFDADGNFVGFDTGNNSPAVLEGALNRVIEYLREIAEAEQKPAVNIENAQINDPQEFIKDSATHDVGSLLGLIQKGL